MVLRFEEPEENEEKPAGEKKVLKENAAPKPVSSGSGSGSGSGKSKKNSHRRVFTNSTYYFAEIEVTIHEATNLAAKKSCCPFCRLYLGSTIFNTATKKKTNSPTFNETFKAKVDRDDFFQLRIYDQAKLERQLEMNEVEAIGKKKIAIKDLAKGESTTEETYKFPQGGEIRISYKITVNPPKVGMIHTKIFSYPSWMNDKYMINIVQPDFESQKTGVNTLTRYAMRWLRNQRVIGNLNNDDDDGSDGEKEEKEELPEGIQFKLLDMSFSCHDKVLQLLVTYQWVPKVVIEEENSVDFSLSQILQIKSFHIDSKLQKKQLNKIKPLSPDAYQKEFKKVTAGLDGLLNEVHSWIEEHKEEISTVFKLIPISTYNSYHAVLWYYR